MIVDTHAYLSRWPFRRLAGDEPAEFVATMRRSGVAAGLGGEFRWAAASRHGGRECAAGGGVPLHGAGGLLVPLGSVNPMLPDWQEDLRRCREVHRMPGIRLHPNYHGYTLANARFGEVLEAATRAGMMVQLVVTMEDERTQHPLMQVAPVELGPLAGVVAKVGPKLRLVVANQKHDAPVKQLAAAGEVYFDFANVERVRGVATLCGQAGARRVVVGSHFPLFYLESSVLKMHEAGLNAGDWAAVSEGNAGRLLGGG